MAVGSGGGQGLMALNAGRPMGPFSSPGPFGNYSAVVAVAGLAGGLAVGVRTLPGTPALALLAITGGLMAALLSETRSAWAALPLMRAIGKAPPVLYFDEQRLRSAMVQQGLQIVCTERHGTRGKDIRAFIVARKPG